MRKLVIATLGSLGDVLPLVAVAKACQKLGFEIIFAANGSFAQTIDSYGLKFASLGEAKDAMIFPAPGREAVADIAVPFIEQALHQLDRHYDVLVDLAADADALLAPYWVLPTHLVAQKLGIPYFACTFSPAYLLRGADSGGAGAARLKAPVHWHTALAALRRRVGLSRVLLPYAEAFTAPVAMLGLFPMFMQQDVVPGIRRWLVCGYPRLQQHAHANPEDEMFQFLDERTVTFSFGSYADACNPAYLFDESVAACRAMGLKCLYLSAFLAGMEAPASDVLVRSYVDHDVVFPRSRLVVHHAGMGSLMSACAHRQPMVCVPFAYDQPHNARRMQQLIDAPLVPMTSYSRGPMIQALASVLNAGTRARAGLNDLMAAETDGAVVAANRLAELLDGWQVDDADPVAGGRNRLLPAQLIPRD